MRLGSRHGGWSDLASGLVGPFASGSPSPAPHQEGRALGLLTGSAERSAATHLLHRSLGHRAGRGAWPAVVLQRLQGTCRCLEAYPALWRILAMERRECTTRSSTSRLTAPPDTPDLVVDDGGAGGHQLKGDRRLPDDFVDLTDVMGRLFKGNSKSKAFQDWEPSHRPALVSAICAGQWPQTRLAVVNGWTDVTSCQLCDTAPGILMHRQTRPWTMPADGWPKSPRHVQKFTDSLSPDLL